MLHCIYWIEGIQEREKLMENRNIVELFEAAGLTAVLEEIHGAGRLRHFRIDGLPPVDPEDRGKMSKRFIFEYPEWEALSRATGIAFSRFRAGNDMRARVVIGFLRG